MGIYPYLPVWVITPLCQCLFIYLSLTVCGYLPLSACVWVISLSIKNEFLLATVGERVVASVPDLIVMVDHETSTPINAERVHYGQRVTVFGIGCPPHYRTERALKVVAPRCFGFDLDYVPIEAL